MSDVPTLGDSFTQMVIFTYIGFRVETSSNGFGVLRMTPGFMMCLDAPIPGDPRSLRRPIPDIPCTLPGTTTWLRGEWPRKEDPEIH